MAVDKQTPPREVEKNLELDPTDIDVDSLLKEVDGNLKEIEEIASQEQETALQTNQEILARIGQLRASLESISGQSSDVSSYGYDLMAQGIERVTGVARDEKFDTMVDKMKTVENALNNIKQNPAVATKMEDKLQQLEQAKQVLFDKVKSQLLQSLQEVEIVYNKQHDQETAPLKEVIDTLSVRPKEYDHNNEEERKEAARLEIEESLLGTMIEENINASEEKIKKVQDALGEVDQLITRLKGFQDGDSLFFILQNPIFSHSDGVLKDLFPYVDQKAQDRSPRGMIQYLQDKKKSAEGWIKDTEELLKQDRTTVYFNQRLLGEMLNDITEEETLNDIALAAKIMRDTVDGPNHDTIGHERGSGIFNKKLFELLANFSTHGKILPPRSKGKSIILDKRGSSYNLIGQLVGKQFSQLKDYSQRALISSCDHKALARLQDEDEDDIMFSSDQLRYKNLRIAVDAVLNPETPIIPLPKDLQETYGQTKSGALYLKGEQTPKDVERQFLADKEDISTNGGEINLYSETEGENGEVTVYTVSQALEMLRKTRRDLLGALADSSGKDKSVGNAQDRVAELEDLNRENYDRYFRAQDEIDKLKRELRMAERDKQKLTLGASDVEKYRELLSQEKNESAGGRKKLAQAQEALKAVLEVAKYTEEKGMFGKKVIPPDAGQLQEALEALQQSLK